jgi:uncharacterized protein (TIGR02466 family)|tara:strand:- start:40846 stop:41463 length:618 start_codon:yes stop_codon:yes gene_type:complete
MIDKYIAHDLFPTPVYQNNIPVTLLNELKQEEYREIIPDRNGYYTKNVYILDKYTELKKTIEQHIHCYVTKHMMIKDIYTWPILNSWVNRHVKGDFAHKHFHCHSLISGIYYLKAPTDGGMPMFHKPDGWSNLLGTIFNFELSGDNGVNKLIYKINVKDGDLILFPSHLFHSVEESKTDEERYSLAFNVWVGGQFGSSDIGQLSV